jgi:hypothetical protein
MMPTPYVLNDAVVIKQKIKPSAKIVEVKLLNSGIQYAVKKDSVTVVKDSLIKQ